MFDENIDVSIDQISDSNKITREEEIEYFTRYQNGEDLLNIIFNKYSAFVPLVASRYKSFTRITCHTFNDLVQYGNMGLIKAIEKYDVSMDIRFLTYAAFWIRQYITRGIFNDGYTIRIPVYLIGKYQIYCREYDRISKELNREPSQKEMIELSCLSIRDINSLKKFIEFKNLFSYDDLYRDSEEGAYYEPTNDDEITKLTDKLDEKRLKTIIFEMLDDVKLTKNQREIIIRRFGLLGNKPHTVYEIALELNICKQRVSEELKNALRKIRKSKYTKSLSFYRDDPYYSMMRLNEEIEIDKEKQKRRRSKIC